ncbi:MAG: hypothetical protein VYD34_03665 [Verrucomicrobiota bacterium]|jgi:hypothetical protein|nr:hypothetical protein [Verrucomicrobiota bacterium]
MKRRLIQWVLITSALCLLALATLLLFAPAFLEVLDPMLNVWLGFCRAVTPEVWQVRGNIPLGLGWLFSGVVIYSMLTGAIFVVSAAGIEKLCEPKKEPVENE